MHVENALVEFVTAGEQEYKEVIEGYEEEVFLKEEASKPSTTDIADHPPAQGKPRCLTLILNNHLKYIYDVHLRYMIYIETTCIDKPT